MFLILHFKLQDGGQIKGDEHLCLSATRTVHTSDQWHVQLKECGEYENEYWVFNEYVSVPIDQSSRSTRAAAVNIHTS